MSAIAFDRLGELFAPLDDLLASGGDTRLHLDPETRLNGYGCRPFPRPEAFTFASSTATSISARAYARAETERAALIRAALRDGLGQAVDDRVEGLRDELRAALDLADAGIDIVFSPSGTDSELHAVFIARTLLGTPLASVIAAADETGSGVAHAACGKHFNVLTAQGAAVEKGRPILGLAEDVQSIGVPLSDERGRTRASAAMDEAVLDAVAQAVTSGRRVLLQAMDHSKLGRRCPSLDCLIRVGERWGDQVQIVIDACQMRLGRARLRWHLDQGHMVLITGSKFFTGPPFSGALLVPASISARMKAVATLPPGLGDYTSRSDWPRGWQGLRAGLAERSNLGQLLRWIAALEEMRAYFAVPDSYRRAALAQFAEVVAGLIAGEAHLELLPDDGTRHADDGEMAVRTIFPFRLRRAGHLLTFEECTALYRALNEDVSSALPPSASSAQRRLAAQLCHIGQPVALADPVEGDTAALRISAGARVVSETWCDAGEAAAHANLQREFEQVRLILAKIDLLLRHAGALGRAVAAAKHAAA
jgi:hypothetical protein